MARPTKPANIPEDKLAQLPQLPDVADDIETSAGIVAEWAHLHRARRRRQISPAEFKEFLYSLQVGGPLVKAKETAEMDRLLYEQARRIDAGRTVATQPADDIDDAEPEALPAPGDAAEVAIATAVAEDPIPAIKEPE